MTKVLFKPLDGADVTLLPKQETKGAAGFDLAAQLDAPIELGPMERVLVPTRFAMAMEEGYEAQIRPRSGLSIKHGITVVNTPGTIDADYRGEVKVPMINLSNEVFIIEHGMRVAQMIIAKLPVIEIELVDELDQTLRGEGGFGSTGLKG